MGAALYWLCEFSKAERPVSDKKTFVLVAGIDTSAFEALGPVLDRQDFEVERMASLRSSVDLAQLKHFNVVIINARCSVETLALAVAAIRDEKSASKKTSLLVMAEPGAEDAARELIGRGVNRVMSVDDSPEMIAREVTVLLTVALRAAVRVSVNFKASISDGIVDVVAEVINLSVSGMLVETDIPFAPDDKVVVSTDLGGQWGPVSIKAVVVRRAYPARGGIGGIGIRFTDLAVEVKEKINGFLDEFFAKQFSS